jgi:hypothetical protein
MADYGALIKRATEAASKGFRAWHASPHDFEKLDIGRIGTGQGAASFGEGIYSAQNPKVSGLGGEYWKEFARRTQVNTPEWYAQNKLEEVNFDRAKAALEARKEAADYEAAIKKGEGVRFTPYDLATDEASAQRAADRWNRAADLLADPNAKVGPRVYELGIKRDPSEFLDWDAPLGGQKAVERMPSLLDAVRREAQDRAVASTTAARQNELYNIVKTPEIAPGDFAYHGMLSQHGRFQPGGKTRFRTEALDADIPGIRYYDQGSRRWAAELSDFEKALERSRANPSASPEDIAFQEKRLQGIRERMPELTRNYVLHGTDYVDILRKLGIVGTPLGAAGMQGPPEQ